MIKQNLNKLKYRPKKLMTILAAFSLLLAGCVYGVAIYRSNTRLVTKAQNSYSCCEITFSEEQNNPSSNATIDGSKIGTLLGFTTGDLVFSNWTNANYKNGVSASAIKIGGSKTNKYAGSFTVTSSTYNFDKVIVYATGWVGDNSTSLIVNNVGNDISATASGGTYIYSAYTYEFENSSTLTFSNNATAFTKQRVLISKIIFRAYSL